jgi:hypothetical protein
LRPSMLVYLALPPPIRYADHLPRYFNRVRITEMNTAGEERISPPLPFPGERKSYSGSVLAEKRSTAR